MYIAHGCVYNYWVKLSSNSTLSLIHLLILYSLPLVFRKSSSAQAGTPAVEGAQNSDSGERDSLLGAQQEDHHSTLSHSTNSGRKYGIN